MPEADPVAVVVLNWNAWNETVACLGGLLRQDVARLCAIVVDNGSTDGSLERFRAWAEASPAPLPALAYGRAEAEAGGDPGREAALAAGSPARWLVTVDARVNLGFAAGNNVGLRYALARGFRLALVLNNDTTLPGDAVRRLAETLASHPEWEAVAPKLVSQEDPRRVLYAGGALRLGRAQVVHLGRNRLDGPQFSGARETGHVTACCGLYRAEFLATAGLFDESFFFGHEDGALSVLAARLHRRLGVALDVAVEHREGTSLADRRPLSVYYFNKYRLLLVRRYGTGLQRIGAFLFLLATRSVKLPVLAVRRRGDLARAELAAYRDYLAGRLAEFDRERARARVGGGTP